ncbi:MAG: hypothetical protein IIY06_01330, partial [Proteobacteria bacterium]|nr:hypothetical protein [Pseudomonadota bacterium]
MIKLIISIVALYFGALIYPFVRKHPAWLSFFDAFVLVSIIGLTLLHLIPHSIEAAGGWALLASAIGFGALSSVHLMQPKHAHAHTQRGFSVVVVLALAGIIIHTLLDGMALDMSSGANNFSQALGLGVLFHRLPVGIFIAMLLVPRYGMKMTLAALTGMAVSTATGAAISHFAIPHLGLMVLNLLQALIAGMLLHVAFHNISVEGEGHGKKHWAISKGVGTLVGLGVLFLVDFVFPVHEGHGDGVMAILFDRVASLTPFWLAAVVCVGAAYALDKRGNGIGRRMVSILDPQPTPAIVDAKNHAFSAVSLAALASVFKPWMAMLFFGGYMLVSLYARAEARRFQFCSDCQRTETDGRCAQNKTFTLWLATSWTQLAIFALIIALMPSFLAPVMAEGSAYPGVVAGILIAGCILGWVIKRGWTLLVSTMLSAGTIWCFDIVSPLVIACILAASWGAAILYDYHPDFLLRLGLDDSMTLKRLRRMKLVVAAMTLVLAVGAGGLIYAMMPSNGRMAIVTMPKAELHHHDHHHGESHEGHGHADALAHEGHGHADALAHEGHGHADALAHEGHGHADALAHEGHGHADALAHEGHATHGSLSEDVHIETEHSSDLLHLLLVILFCGCGIVGAFRHGPRKLVEMALGLHGHSHEHGDHAHDHACDHDHECDC